MSAPSELPGPGGPAAPARAPGAGVAASLGALALPVALSVAAGFAWAAVAPRPLLQITSPGAAGLVSAESNAFIAADAAYCLICLVGGVVSGLLGYLFAVRRHGPLPMAAVVVGAVAAACLTRWIGEQSGLATFHHQLATLRPGARLRGSLMLGATGALAFWPLAASLVAGGMAALAKPPGRRRAVPGGGAARAPGAP